MKNGSSESIRRGEKSQAMLFSVDRGPAICGMGWLGSGLVHWVRDAAVAVNAVGAAVIAAGGAGVVRIWSGERTTFPAASRLIA